MDQIPVVTAMKNRVRVPGNPQPALPAAAAVVAVFLGVVLAVGLVTVGVMALLLEAGLIEVQEAGHALPLLPGQA